MNIELDPATRRLRPTILFGGSPARFLRLGAAGVAAMEEIETGDARSTAAIELAGRLIEAGMANQRPEPAAGSETRTVSVVIPVYDRDVADLVAGLQRSVPDAHEIIVVDDASPPAAARRLAELAAETPGVRLIRHDTNRGPAAARNTGVAAVGSSRVLFLDSDCEVPTSSGWLEILLGYLDPDGPGVVAVAPRIVAAASSVVTGPAGGVAQLYDGAFCPLDMGPQRGLVGPDRRVRYVPTAALLVDLESARGVLPSTEDLFDPSLRFGEDVDLVWRLVENGARVAYEPSVLIDHREPVNIGGLLRRRFNYGRSAAELGRRHRGQVAPLAVSPWSVVAVAGGVIGSLPQVALSFGAQAANLDARLNNASLPTDGLDRAVATGLVHTALGVGRYLNQFWWPVVAAVALRSRVPATLRVRLVALCLGRSIEEAWRHDGSVLERLGLAATRTVDDAAYGAGVWRGALARRDLRVVLPRWAGWKPTVG